MRGEKPAFGVGKRSAIAVGFLLSASLVLFFTFYQPSTPDGIYYDSGLACTHGCWILKGGKIYVQCDNEAPRASGSYAKSGQAWVSETDPKSPIIFQPGLLGLKVVGTRFQHGRAFWPRDSFSWFYGAKK